MPSPGDLAQLGRLFVSYSADDRLNLSGDFMLGVVSSYGSYMFKISNIEKFVSFYVNNLASSADLARFEANYSGQYNLSNGNMGSSWENNFLKMLKDYDAGMKMYCNSDDNKKWQEKTVNNFDNTPNNGPCSN